jgi:hypothetical protein
MRNSYKGFAPHVHHPVAYAIDPLKPVAYAIDPIEPVT